MGRETLDTYVFGSSPELRRERDDLVAELTAWAEAKLKAGTRPIPLQRALLDVSELAGGVGPEGHPFGKPHKPT